LLSLFTLDPGQKLIALFVINVHDEYMICLYLYSWQRTATDEGNETQAVFKIMSVQQMKMIKPQKCNISCNLDLEVFCVPIL